MTLQEYNKALFIFGSIDKVKRHLDRDKKDLADLRVKELIHRSDVVWKNQNGTTIVKTTPESTFELNKKILNDRIHLWTKLLEKHEEILRAAV
ncbi:hypothetical protein QTG56_24710 (plasmid) [Rossellomorea sp. AcN35-11]|nr:hypothetical protein [Rossellomorea aquimaris]WJV31838.1 hypothetical protein QTG56_24710 [Rossellomorea sp. AcN35-11]